MHITNSIYLIYGAFARIFRRLRVKILTLSVVLCGFLSADNLYVFGTFDFNQNGRSEIITISRLGTSLDFIELNRDGGHNKIWTYDAQKNGASILDAKFSDLNDDGFPEIVIIQSNGDEKNWIKIFEWNGFDFSPNNNPTMNVNGAQDKIRPSNLSVLNNVFAFSKSSPTRSIEVFNLEIVDVSGKISKSKTYTHPLVSNGYGPVFTGLFSTNGDVFSALISPESNVLKTSLFSITSPDRLPISDLIVTNGARVILGPYIQAFDENKDGNQELLIPFATGEVYLLSMEGDSVSFIESKLSQKGLFSEVYNEDEINNMLLARVELGLYDNSPFDFGSSSQDSLLLFVSDTLMLGDTLRRPVLADNDNVFYSFNWQSPPPIGMVFNPQTNTINWVPTREDIGVVDFSYKIDIRIKEEVISGLDDFGDTHQLYPILESILDSSVLLVSDTTKIPEPVVIVPTMFHGISVTSTDIADSNRFIFEGEAPFSTTTFNKNGLITVGVSADLSTIKQNKSGSFVFKSSQEKPGSIMTLSLIHDLSTNIFYATLSGSKDTLNQSFDPEGWQTNLYEYPEYFFEGFPETMVLDTLDGGGLSLMSTGEKKSGTVILHSPLYAKDHSIEFSYFGGRPYAVRGNINVKEDGSHKTLTEIDFESSFTPLNISSLLVSANRDTFVFALDSVPDTLETPINYRSFYSPVKIINEKINEDSFDTNEQPTAPTTTEIKETEPTELTPIDPNSGLNSEQSDSLDNNIVVPADTSSISIDSLLITTPVLEPESPTLPDSVKTPSIEMPADSTK